MGNEASQEGGEAGAMGPGGGMGQAGGGGGGFAPLRGVGPNAAFSMSAQSSPRPPQFSGPVPGPAVLGQSGMPTSFGHPGGMPRPPSTTFLNSSQPAPMSSLPPVSNLPPAAAAAAPAPAATAAAGVPDVDLSHLSAEEQAMIFQVMARAENMEKTPEVPIREAEIVPKRTGQQFIRRACPMCHINDIPPNQNDCADCRLKVCHLCGSLMPSPTTKIPEWVCNTCAKRRQQQIKAEAAHQTAEQYSQEHSNDGNKYHSPQYSHQGKSAHQDSRSYNMYQDSSNGHQRNQVGENGDYDRYRQDGNGMQMTKEGGRVISMISNKPKPATPVVVVPEPAVYSDDEEDNDILESDDSEYENEQRRRRVLEIETAEQQHTYKHESETKEETSIAANKLQRDNNKLITSTSEKSETNSQRNQMRESNEITTANLINQIETCMSNGFWDSQDEIMRTNVTLSNNEDLNETNVDVMSHLEEEDEDEEPDNYENDTHSSDALPLECFEHNPGEVYTILEEEEDDGLSPNDQKCLKWHRGAVPTYPDPVTMKPKRLGDPPTVVNNQNVLTTKPLGQHMKGGDHGPSELRAPQSGRSDTSGVVSSRISESVSPDFASSGAGMAISNMISSSQIHQQHSHSQQSPIRKSQQSSSQPQQSQGMYGPQGISNGTTGSPNHGSLQKGNVSNSPPTKMKVKAIDLQSQKKSKSKPDPQDWSPTNDLSPILDVSPSLEAAEQEQMAKYQVQNQLGMGGMQQQFPNQFQHSNMGMGGNMHMGQGYDGQMTAPSKSATGTISGMLADFSKALGLGSSTQGEKPPSNINQHPITPAQKQLNQNQPGYNSQQQFQPVVQQLEHVQRMKLQNAQQQSMMQQQVQPQHQQQGQPQHQQQGQPQHQQQGQPQHQQQMQSQHQQQMQSQHQQQMQSQHQQQMQLQHQQQMQPSQQQLQQQAHLQQQSTLQQQQQHSHSQHQQQAHLQQQQQTHLHQQQQANLHSQQQANLHSQQQANLHQQQQAHLQQQQNIQQQHLQQHNIQQQQHFQPQNAQQFQQQTLQNQQFQHQQQQMLQHQYQQMVQQQQDHNSHLQSMHHPSQQEMLAMQQSGMGQMQGQQQWTIDNGMQEAGYQSGHYPMHQMAMQSQHSSGMSGSPKTKPRTVVTSAIGVTPVMGVPAGTLIRQSGSPQIGRREQVIGINKGPMTTEVALGNMMMGTVAKPLPAPRLSQQNKVDDTPTTVTAFSHAHVTAAVKAVATMAEKEEAQSGEHAETSARSLDSPGTPSRRLQTDDHNKRTGEMVGPSLPRPFSPLAAIGTYSCTPSSTPQTPQSQRGGDSDTQSEADSTKSTKVRRRLPPLPADQDLFNPRHHSGSRLGYPIRWDGTTRSRSSLGKYAYLDASRPYSSDSEANLKDMYYGDSPSLKATKSISATNLCGAAGQYDLYTRYDAAGMSGSATGRPLTRSALDRYDRPHYINNQRLPIRKEFEDKYRSSVGYKDAKTAQLKRELIAAGILPKNFDMPISTPSQRLRDQSSLKSAHLSQMAMLSKLEQRKRQLSEHQLYGLTRSRTLRNIEKKLNDQKPFKSFEYECIDEGYRNKSLLKKTMTADPILTRPSTSLGALTDPYSSSYDGTNLRDTPIGWSRNNFHLQNYMPDTPSGSLLSSHTYRGPRNINRSLSQEAISWKSDSYKRQALSYLNEDILRAHQNIQGHQRSYKSRSWHPSPSVSEDEDDQFNREEKKQKIKAEIARRRKQIEENVLLHKELIRLAQSRQNAQDTYDSHGSAIRSMLPSKTISGSNTYGYLDDSGYGLEIASLQGSYHRQPHRPLDQSRSMPSISSQDEFKESGSVLRSINEILQNDYSRAPSFDTNYDSPYYSQESVGPLLYNRLQNSRFESHDPFPGGYVGEDLYDPQDLMNSYPMQKTNSSKMSYRTGSALKRLSAEDKSIDLIASTFAPEYGYAPASARNNYYGANFNRTYYDRSALGTPPDSTPAMPLLPDMPSRSRKLLEDLQYSYANDGTVISSRPRLQQSQSEDYGSRLGYSNEETDYMEGLSSGIIPRGGSQNNRSLPNPQTVHEPQIRVQPRYPFPVKRIFLTKDYKDKAIGGNGFGLSLIGGKVIPGSNGKLGAFVSKIYHSGVVGTLREVKEGDQVLEWNGIDLTNFTNEEVQKCMAHSDSEVEILVKSITSSEPVKPPRKHLPSNPASNNDNRNTGAKKVPVNSVYYNDDIKDQNNIQKKYSSNNNYNIVSSRNGWGGTNDNNIRRNGDNNIDHLTEDTPSRGSTRSKTLPRLPLVSTHEPERIRGKRSKTRAKKDKNAAEIQLQICYDIKAQILYVSTLQARNLLSNRTSDDKVPDPFVTCQLLPGRNVENQRKTRYVSRNSNPEWKQTMVYPNIPPEELKKRYLEVTVWNFDSSQQNEFMGEVLVDLSTPTTFNEDPRWYPLKEHQECQIRNLECTTTTVPPHVPPGLNRRDASHARQVPPTPTNRKGQIPKNYNDEIERNSGVEVGMKMMK